MDEFTYTPKVKGAKKLGSTRIICTDPRGGFNIGPNDYIASLPNGDKLESKNDFDGESIGLDPFKKKITEWYRNELNVNVR